MANAKASKKGAARGKLILYSEWRRQIRDEFDRLVKNAWPEKLDGTPFDSKYTLQEIDWAIRLLRKRRENWKKRQPRRQRGGQLLWNEVELTALLAVHDEQRRQGRKGDELLNLLGGIFRIRDHKKIQARLKEARNLRKPVNQKKVIRGGGK